MIRALTTEEKALSQAAKKRSNKALSAERAKIRKQRDVAFKANASEAYRDGLLRQLLSINKDVKGSPAIVRLSSVWWTGGEIVIDYELLRGMLRRLKGRYISSMKVSGGVLTIVHSVPFQRNRGEVELYQIPDYQRIHLTDLPVIELDFD
ncbi:hypothetical protein KIH86_17765 [Paenibacillus sp. HN-1]|uniref:hypothetical protein n=1 Tax=Paenibacillus TaxID=44249 RepID=UPI001CA9DF34|nr:MULTISPECIES: hypothetical protein [Paenibacillus]MBY9078283.1 hypothetical protein [Paenibacillus sp. CGMCC 1.18879]MBY9086058.1 hypothetical protein [Paenibacillus sinensis]